MVLEPIRPAKVVSGVTTNLWVATFMINVGLTTVNKNNRAAVAASSGNVAAEAATLGSGSHYCISQPQSGCGSGEWGLRHCLEPAPQPPSGLDTVIPLCSQGCRGGNPGLEVATALRLLSGCYISGQITASFPASHKFVAHPRVIHFLKRL